MLNVPNDEDHWPRGRRPARSTSRALSITSAVSWSDWSVTRGVKFVPSISPKMAPLYAGAPLRANQRIDHERSRHIRRLAVVRRRGSCRPERGLAGIGVDSGRTEVTIGRA